MFFKTLLKYVLAFQICFSGAAQANLDFDFSDDPPDVVTPGEDYDGYDDGNCVGSGCDDSGDDGRGDYDDDGPPDHDRGDQHENGDFDRSDWESRDHGFHGADKPSSQHFGFDTDNFVKTPEGKLLTVKGLLECAGTYTCAEKGYGQEFWKFQGAPNWTYEEGSTYGQGTTFAKLQNQLNKKMAEAHESINGSAKPESQRLLAEAKTLQSLSHETAHRGELKEAFKLTAASKELVKAALDIAVGFSPIGWPRDIYEALTGKSLLESRPLSNSERTWAVIGALTPAIGSFAIAGARLLQRAEKLGHLPGTLNKTLHSVKVRTAEEINRELGYAQDAFKPGTKVYEFTTSDVIPAGTFSRAFNETEKNSMGKWITETREIKGLTAKEIQDKLALPFIPTHTLELNKLPAGTVLYKGRVAPSFNSSSSRFSSQYLIKGNITPEYFGRPSKIDGRVR
ncbi:hypothetical protein [Bdellovibrio sp. GT3]|uniref:hypothetical protein n=1 Tax=Bdellovibrio sp. GT3 TaxID=3136282 RepID=UPI0030F17B74